MAKDSASKAENPNWVCPNCGRGFQKADQDHSCGKPSTIDAYIAAQREEIRPLLNQIREAMKAAAPKATEKISWNMPTFWQGENLIHFCAFKRHIGIYPGSEAMEVFAPKLTDYKSSKGAFQLPLDRPIDLDFISEITRWRVAQTEAKRK